MMTDKTWGRSYIGVPIWAHRVTAITVASVVIAVGGW